MLLWKSIGRDVNCKKIKKKNQPKSISDTWVTLPTRERSNVSPTKNAESRLMTRFSNLFISPSINESSEAGAFFLAENQSKYSMIGCQTELSAETVTHRRAQRNTGTLKLNFSFSHSLFLRLSLSLSLTAKVEIWLSFAGKGQPLTSRANWAVESNLQQSNIQTPDVAVNQWMSGLKKKENTHTFWPTKHLSRLLHSPCKTHTETH